MYKYPHLELPPFSILQRALRIQNTLKYTQLVSFEAADTYICKVAETKEEIKKLLSVGFEYVCEKDDILHF